MEFKQTEFQQNSIVQVYVAQFPFAVEREKIIPDARAEEIETCTNQHVRNAKYYVWKLLESALMRSFGLEIEELDIKQNKSGKWECPECCFSLSHSGNLAAVAVSMKPVGVDIERRDEVRFTSALARKMLTDGEIVAIERLGEADRGSALNALWTKKEAIFKLAGASAFLPQKIEASDKKSVTKVIKYGEEQYVLTVASDNGEQADFCLAENLELIDIE